MDSFHHHQQHQDRRMLGQTIAGGGGDHQWYPSSSPPPPPGGYFNHAPLHQQHSYPPPPLPAQLHLQQHHHHHPMAMGPPPPQAPPPYNGQTLPVPPPPYLHHGQYPPPPLPPRPQHPVSTPHHPPPPPLPYPPPPNQAWGNPSWAQHQGWEYPERNILYNNDEDWAARAKAWATAKSGTENHHTLSHFSPIGRTDEHTYHDQYQQAAVPPRDVHQPSFPQSSNQQLPVSTMDPLKQVNHLHGSTSFGSGSSFYGTGYTAGDETTNTNADHRASPHKSYGLSSSIYEQEVSYNYSSAPGNREALHQSEGLHIPQPLPVSSVQEGHHSESTLPVQMILAEQPHFSNHRAPANFLPDACDRPLDFERRHDSDHESLQKISYGNAGAVGAIGMVDHDPAASSIHAWAPSTAPGIGFPQIPVGPVGTQFDPTFIPQASLPVQPSPVIGGIPAPSFQSVPPVSAPYALGPGASVHAATFSGDLNGSLNLSDRPKKAAVPNWLREEIIKKKSVIPSAVSTQPTGNSFDSVGSEDADRSLRRVDQGDSKSIDSARSTEDEEDDEEDVEAARSAAINQEIKRVLTEVLLKVTDELFNEIATKVLNENEQTVGAAEGSSINGNQRISPPTEVPTAKASATVLVPLKMKANKGDCADENSTTSSPGGNILGLANYTSDNDDDEIQSSKLLSSGKKASGPHQQESIDKSFDNDFKSVKDETDIDGVAQKRGTQLREESSMTKNAPLSVDHLFDSDKASEGVSAVCEETIPVHSRKVEELPAGSATSLHNIVGANDDKGKESTSGHAKSDKALTKDNLDRESRRDTGTNKNSQNRGNNKASMEKTSRETSETSDPITHEDRNKLKEKTDKREKLKERVDDRSSERGLNVRESDSRRSSKHNSAKDDKKETMKDKREKYKDDGERNRERVRAEKENRSTRAIKDSSRYSRRSPSPSSRGKNIKDNFVLHGSASGDEPSDNSKKRKKLSRNSSLSPSPTKSRKRQVSRSPPSKHSHRRQSPYSSAERRRRSRSTSPDYRRSSAHKRGS